MQIEEKELNNYHSVETQCDIEKCKCLNSLSIVMKMYNTMTSTTDDKQFIDEINIISTLNAFNHLLFVHNTNDYDKIYSMFGADCELTKCRIIRRHYDKNEIYSFKQRILDKIHTHYRHQFDLFKFTKNEKMQTNTNNQRQKAITINDILHRKQNKIRDITQRFQKKENKFCSDFGRVENKLNEKQTEVSQLPQNHNNAIRTNDAMSIMSYSFSFRFNYIEECQYSTQKYSGRLLKDLYVRPKYNTLKEELTQNKIYKFSVQFWNSVINEAEQYKKVDCYKQVTAHTSTYYQKHRFYDDHPVKYGIADGSLMESQHMIAIIIYCGQDKFQSEFTKTYRGNLNDTFDDIKDKHSNFRHFAKSLYQAIHVYGTAYIDGKIQEMYHGIKEQLVFNSISDHIFTVVSTTSSAQVAQVFAGSGLLVTLVPDPQSRYFDCCWLSPYSYEQELLFVGGVGMTHFVDICSTIDGLQCMYTKYVVALRVIDTMTKGRYFNMDPKIYHRKCKMKTNVIKCIEPKYYNGIPQEIQRLVCLLVEHELHRYDEEKHDKIQNIPLYIERLLHQICIHKTEIEMNCKALKVNVLNEYDADYNGYIGYLFMKHYCCRRNEAINFNFLCTLFPFVVSISVFELECITTKFLEDILCFLKGNKFVKYVELRIAKSGKENNVCTQCERFADAFAELEFTVNVQRHPVFGVAYLILKKIEK